MTTFNTSREIPATPEQIFAAISEPERLARWWGPAGFTNTVTVCEFKNGGRWLLTMHGPDGKNYPNEYQFMEINPPSMVVIQHMVLPKFRLTIGLAASNAGQGILQEVTEKTEMSEKNVSGNSPASVTSVNSCKNQNPKTVVSWSQAFEDAKVAAAIERIVVPANEQNLDRLTAEVLRKPGG